MKHRLDSLEIGRFIAALLVTFDHLLLTENTIYAAPGASIFWGLNAPGALAVQFFFVLSGFVMLTAHAGDFGRGLAPFKFWWRRACRLFPVFWIGLIVPLWLYWKLVPRGLMFEQFFLLPWAMWDANYPAWTLHFETAFYIMFGLCLLPWIGRPLLAAWVVVVALFWCPWHLPAVFIYIEPPLFKFLHLTGPTCFISAFEVYFFCGLACGWLYLRAALPWFWGWLPVAAGAVMVAMSQGGADYGLYYPAFGYQLSCAAGLAAVVYGLASLERAGALRFGQWAVWLGAMSYPLYIINSPVMLVCEQFITGKKLHTPALYVFFTIELVLMMVVTPVLTFGFDRPVQRFLRGLSRRGAVFNKTADGRV